MVAHRTEAVRAGEMISGQRVCTVLGGGRSQLLTITQYLTCGSGRSGYRARQTWRRLSGDLGSSRTSTFPVTPPSAHRKPSSSTGGKTEGIAEDASMIRATRLESPVFSAFTA